MQKSDLIYLDYQASTPVCEAAISAMEPFYHELYANPHAFQHLDGLQSFQYIEIARQQIANIIGGDANEIVFTSGATEANNLAVLGVQSNGQARKRILISSIEHKCVISPAEHLKSRGFDVEFIPVTDEGEVNFEAYQKMLGGDVHFVSIMTVNNEIGVIQDVKRCAALAKHYGAYFHTDAAQAPVGLDIDVEEWGVDLLSLSSHKMYGPKGIGALYVSKHIQDKLQPIIYGGGQENGMRSGTLPTSLCVGFGESANYLSIHKSEIRDKIRECRNYFWASLRSRLNCVQLVGPALEKRVNGNLNIAFEQLEADMLLSILQTDIAASTGSACTSGTIEPSHVLSALGLDVETSNSCIRFSFGFNMNKVQIDGAVDKICNAVKQMKSEFS